MRKLNFRKEKDGSWYIVLKSWPGPKSALQMVAGADNLLDRLSNNGDAVTIGVKKKSDSKKDITCVKTKEKSDYGRWYEVFANEKAFLGQIWLCPVTRFVFRGFYPETIIFENLTDERTMGT